VVSLARCRKVVEAFSCIYVHFWPKKDIYSVCYTKIAVVLCSGAQYLNVAALVYCIRVGKESIIEHLLSKHSRIPRVVSQAFTLEFEIEA
jgi:hypothetical protein